MRVVCTDWHPEHYEGLEGVVVSAYGRRDSDPPIAIEFEDCHYPIYFHEREIEKVPAEDQPIPFEVVESTPIFDELFEEFEAESPYSDYVDDPWSTEPADFVNLPPHYTSHPSGVECIEITEHMNFCLGNALKYVWRAGLKGPNPIEDLQKAVFYIEREIARIEGDSE